MPEHPLNETNVRLSFPARCQKLCTFWQEKNKAVLKHRQKLLALYASGFFDDGYEREHLINLIDRAVTTIVPFLVEGNPRCLVETIVANLRPWAFTTQLALNYLIDKMNLAENVLIPVAINSMFGAGIVRTISQYDRRISLENETIKLGNPAIVVIDDSDYIGDPTAKRRLDFIIEGDVYQLPTEYAKDLFAGKDKFGNQIADYIVPDRNLTFDFSPDEITAADFEKKKLSLRDHTTFIDLYLYDEGTIITILPEYRTAKILREIECEFPESPYDYLGYNYFPNSPIVIPPAWRWHDLDVSMNILARTAREQAESQKNIIVAEPPAKQAAKKVVAAKNMDVIVTSDSDKVKTLAVGGVNPENYQWMQFAELAFTKTGANPDILGGRGSQSPTFGQEQMVFRNASRVINNMYSRFQNFTNSALKKFAWKVWTDPTVYIPVIKEIPGLYGLPEVFVSPDKVADFNNFVFKIVPYSTQRISPELKYSKLMQFAMGWLLPTARIAAQQGASLDIPLLSRIMAEYIEIGNFNQFYKTAVPHELDAVGYQMKPLSGGKTKKENRFGQGVDMFGATEESREANKNQQQERTMGSVAGLTE